MSVNKVILVGRLGQDPELKHTPSGQAVCNFSVATSESWQDKQGNKQEKTEWTRIVVWGKLAEISAQYLTKGKQVYLEGKLATRSWEDKEGRKCYATEVIANNVQFLGGQQQQAQQSQTQQPQAQQSMYDNRQQHQQPPQGGFTADDIPF